MTAHPFHYDMPSQRISDSEIVVQKVCLKMIAKLFPDTRVAAVPNAGKRSRWEQGRAKAEGMSKGFPDLILVGGAGLRIIHPVVAFVELKAKAAMTPEQKDWLLFLVDCGHNCGVFRSDETLAAKMKDWGFR